MIKQIENSRGELQGIGGAPSAAKGEFRERDILMCMQETEWGQDLRWIVMVVGTGDF